MIGFDHPQIFTKHCLIGFLVTTFAAKPVERKPGHTLHTERCRALWALVVHEGVQRLSATNTLVTVILLGGSTLSLLAIEVPQSTPAWRWQRFVLQNQIAVLGQHGLRRRIDCLLRPTDLQIGDTQGQFHRLLKHVSMRKYRRRWRWWRKWKLQGRDDMLFNSLSRLWKLQRWSRSILRFSHHGLSLVWDHGLHLQPPLAGAKSIVFSIWKLQSRRRWQVQLGELNGLLRFIRRAETWKTRKVLQVTGLCK
mmetsp:Transcript_34932/g.71142  ORF Transcript_34932/g.71142 Transcript_34932/m.71142 type:complete len:251 (+) Transcript_34932:45-797(+)